MKLDAKLKHIFCAHCDGVHMKQTQTTHTNTIVIFVTERKKMGKALLTEAILQTGFQIKSYSCSSGKK